MKHKRTMVAHKNHQYFDNESGLHYSLHRYYDPEVGRYLTPDPVKLASCAAGRRILNGRRYAALRFRGPGTDLTVGLADDHGMAWRGDDREERHRLQRQHPNRGGLHDAAQGACLGTRHLDRPLSYQGTLIDGIQVRFEEGRIVEAKARRGEEVLRKVLETDEGARRLGEVALVPNSSPISASGLLFYNTLYDENAACHIALGQAYSKCIRGGLSMSEKELVARGCNRSLIRIDWMIGSGAVDIDSLAADGTATPVMRAGEWA